MVKMIVKPSSVKGKKYTAIFYNDEGKKIKTSQFGASGYEDFTMHKDKKRREKYRARHKNNLSKTDYTSPAHLSYYLLWGNSTSLKTNISNYKKKFNLS